MEKVFEIKVSNVFVPIVKTLPARPVDSEFVLEGELLSDGASAVMEMGIIVTEDWRFDQSHPSTRTFAAADFSERFTVEPRELEPATRYYYRAYAVNAEGINYGAKKRFTTPDSKASGPWANAAALGAGWFRTWLGDVYLTDDKWIYHGELGWLYAVGENESSVWLWSENLGWSWSGAGTFPYLYRNKPGGWLYQLSTDRGPALYDFRFQFWFHWEQMGK